MATRGCCLRDLSGGAQSGGISSLLDASEGSSFQKYFPEGRDIEGLVDKLVGHTPMCQCWNRRHHPGG